MACYADGLPETAQTRVASHVSWSRAVRLLAGGEDLLLLLAGSRAHVQDEDVMVPLASLPRSAVSLVDIYTVSSMSFVC